MDPICEDSIGDDDEPDVSPPVPMGMLRQLSSSPRFLPHPLCSICRENLVDGTSGTRGEGSKVGLLRLTCRCVIHYNCMVEYLKSWIRDSGKYQQWGIACPNAGGDCVVRLEQGRTAYVMRADVTALLAYGEANQATDVVDAEGQRMVASLLDPQHVDQFERFSQDKLHELSCGCRVRYEELVPHIISHVTAPADKEADGITCPMRAHGTCKAQAIQGIYITREDVRTLAALSVELPPYSPGSDPGRLLDEHMQAFASRFDRHVALGCRCLVHFNTITSYLKAAFDAASESLPQPPSSSALRPAVAPSGDETTVLVTCPHNEHCQFKHGRMGQSVDDEYVITAEDVDRVLATDEGAGGGTLPVELVAWLRSMCSAAAIPKANGAKDEEDPTMKFVTVTTKKCPNVSCQVPQSKWHGHECHHVTGGCRACKTEFCFRCLSTEEENVAQRGERCRCKCGSWSNFCKPLDTTEDVAEHLALEPYPHDKQCGCPICPDCRTGAPCNYCNGRCVVCKGLVRHGPAGWGETYDPCDVELTAEAMYRRATMYHQSGLLDTAVEWFRRAADAGHAAAQGWLGYCYYQGEGVEKNFATAVQWFTLAAEQGDGEAQCSLGQCYFEGEGVKKNLTAAVEWFRRAAEQGNVDAEVHLGECYYKGRGVEKNLATAVEWWRRAAEQGDPVAQFELGSCYRDGGGVKKNLTTAAQWYRRAAVQGDADSQYELGLCYRKGRGVEEDFAMAATWFRRAAEQGNADAQCHLGLWYYKGKGVEKDWATAAEWLLRAAEQGDDQAQYEIGLCFYKGHGVVKNVTKALEWFRLAAERGNDEALYKLGMFLYNGKHVAKDKVKAADLFGRAAEQGHALAKYMRRLC